MATRAERALTRVRKLCTARPDVEERLSHGAPTFFYRGTKAFVMFHDDHHGDGLLAIWCHAPAGVQGLLVTEEPEDVDWDDVAGIGRDAYRMVVPPKVADALGG
jgi:hypothetical protein